MKKTNNQEYEDFNELIDESKRDLSDYIEKRLTLAKLKTYEKVANFSSRLLYGMILLIFGLILFFLLLITSGLYLGHLLNNYSAGFGILILINLFVVILAICNQKKIRRLFMSLTISTIKKIESDEE